MKKTATHPAAAAEPVAAHTPLAMPMLAPALAGYRWALALGTGMTALTLELLRAQQAALGAASAATPMAPAGARLTVREIYDRMAAAGYREISEIEWDDGCYEVEARDAQGRAVELRVNGDTGAIEREQLDD
ncbi:hypothetical protein GCM10022279_24640 [Comamonas faecalis]|uniref:PepSY domain-containing protein n=1 Tax=Comamonas faecalis TaxID=1387849 RepID=A0ABP7RNG0_9BURK